MLTRIALLIVVSLMSVVANAAGTIRMVPGLEEPLVANGNTNAEEDAALDSAISAFHQSVKPTADFPENAAPFDQFLTAHPSSPWQVSIRTNLGLGYFRAGYFTKAVENWELAWTSGRDATAPAVKALVDRAVGELARMHARVGHAKELEQLFAEMGDRQANGPATEMVTGAREGLWMFRNDPGISYLCGPKALKNLLAFLKADPAKLAALDNERSGPHGYSLGQVGDLATRLGLSHKLVYRTGDQPVPVPSIINWKLQHYAAIVGEQDGRYHIQDPTFGGGDLWITRAAIDAEGSGYFLVPDSAGPADSWRVATAEEAQQVYGMGFTAQNQPGSTTPGDNNLNDSNCGAGMCVANAKTMVVSLNLNDTPVGYTPPKGPPVKIRLTYNQREASQPAVFGFFNVSPKWTLNVLSWVQDDPAFAGRSVLRYVAGGGSIDYASVYTYNSTTGQFSPERQGQAVLVRIPATGPVTSYELRLPDGSKQVFGFADGATVAPRRMFLTQRVDPSGNALTLNYDSQLRLTTLTDATGRNTTFSYGDITRPLLVTQIADPFGRRATLAYDNTGRLSSITDVLGLTSSFSYDAGNLVNGMTTPYGTSTFAYGQNTAANSRFLDLTDPLGQTERIEFLHTAPGIHLSDPVAPAGVQNIYLYYRNTFHWDKHLYPTTHTDYTKARITHWLHNPLGQTSPIVESVKAPLENRVWNRYPGQSGTYYEGTADTPTGTARVLDDGTTQAQAFTYNAIGRPLTSIDPLGRLTVYTYDMNNIDLLKVQKKTATSGTLATIASFTYNSQHLPLTSTDAAGQVTTYTYNPAGQLTSVTNALGETTRYAYDVLGRLTTVTNANGAVQESLTYDAFDRVATRTDSEGYVLAYAYDALDRVIGITYPDATTTQYTYDKLDLVAEKDRLGRVTTRTYDANRRLVSVTDPLNQVTSYAYYANDALKSITDPKGNVTSWEIDIEGRPTTKHYADGSTETYAYENTTSRPKSTTDPLAQVKTFGYFNDDALKNMTYTNTVNPTSNVTFAYDPFFKRRVSMTDGIGTTTWSYVPLGTVGALQLASETGPFAVNNSIVYTYDVLGRPVTQAVDTATESFAYDQIGRLTQHVNALGTFNYGYLGQTGQVANRSLVGSTIATTYGYDTNTNDRRLLAIGNSGATRSFGFTMTPENRITAITETPGTGASTLARSWAMTYDTTDRLLSAVATAAPSGGGNGGTGDDCDDEPDEHHDRDADGAGHHESHDKKHAGRSEHEKDKQKDKQKHKHKHRDPNCQSTPPPTSVTQSYAYGYDAADNITSFVKPVGTNTGTYNSLNELTARGTQPYSYDANGNLLNDGVRNHQWDAESRLIGISLVATPTTTTQFKYDGLDRRLAIIETSGITTTETRYLWCGSEICQARDAADTVTRRYFAEGESQIGGRNLITMQDQLGSTRDTVDVSTGARVDSFDYDPYGSLTTGATATARPGKLYAGMLYHTGSGLYLTKYRAYDSTTGRWISRDPLREGIGSNLYTYVLNNPLRWIDPTGLAVTITINRTTYTPNSIVGTINVTSTVTSSTFSGNTLENRSPPNSNLPVPPGTYPASVRTDHTPNRIELTGVPNATNIQIHPGNTPSDVQGCFAVGTSTSTNYVGNSVNAMNSINNIITLDGSGNITVIISGSATGP